MRHAKKYYAVKVVTAHSVEEARQKLESNQLDHDNLNTVVPGKKLHREISKRTVVPPRYRNRK